MTESEKSAKNGMHPNNEMSKNEVDPNVEIFLSERKIIDELKMRIAVCRHDISEAFKENDFDDVAYAYARKEAFNEILDLVRFGHCDVVEGRRNKVTINWRIQKGGD